MESFQFGLSKKWFPQPVKQADKAGICWSLKVDKLLFQKKHHEKKFSLLTSIPKLRRDINNFLPNNIPPHILKLTVNIPAEQARITVFE